MAIEWICDHFIHRRYAELGIDLPIKTTLEILLHFSERSENFGTCETMAGCLMRQKHIEWKFCEV